MLWRTRLIYLRWLSFVGIRLSERAIILTQSTLSYLRFFKRFLEHSLSWFISFMVVTKTYFIGLFIFEFLFRHFLLEYFKISLFLVFLFFFLFLRLLLKELIFCILWFKDLNIAKRVTRLSFIHPLFHHVGSLFLNLFLCFNFLGTTLIQPFRSSYSRLSLLSTSWSVNFLFWIYFTFIL